jgi:hypothetical protein
LADYGSVIPRESRVNPKVRKSFGVLTVRESTKSRRGLTLRFRDGKVPVAIRVGSGGTIYATPFSEAQLVLIDRLDCVLDRADMLYDFYGTMVSALFVPGTDATYVYFKVDQELNPTTPEILATLSRHFMGDFCFYYNMPVSVENIIKATGVTKHNTLHHTAESIRSLPISKISGEHHIHFLASEVWDSLSPEKQARASAAFQLPAESSTSFMAGVMLWLASLDDDLYRLIIETGVLCSSTVSEFAKAGKRLSVQAKSLQNLAPIDLRPIFECDVLVNRMEGTPDWEAEREHRLHPDLARVSAEEAYTTAFNLFRDTDETKKKPMRYDWEKFWDARWQWSASGSVHSQYAEDLKYVMPQRELKNKFITLINHPDVKLTHFTSRQPSLHAWSSVKYEWGKVRAIYGTDLTSYVLTHFAFFNCEDTLPAHFPVGSKARPSYVNARISSLLKDALPFCIDYEDFNSQHSIPAMQAVMQAYIDANSRHMSKDQIAAAQWAIQSVGNTVVHDNMGTKTTYQAQGSLMSGWRLTTFINSVLNYVYTKKIIGMQDTVYRSVHNGDDVLIGAKNFKMTVDAVKNAELLNIRLQRTKSSFGGIAEFLRVDHIRGSHGQYLTRNIATLVHSRIESKLAISLVDVVDAFEERIAEYISRGGLYKIATALRDVYYARTSNLFGNNKEDAYMIKTSHRVVGGISAARDSLTSHLISVTKQKSEVVLKKNLPGIQAYATRLAKTLDLNVPIAKICDRVYTATLNAVQLVRKRISIEKVDDEQRYQVYKGLYKAYSDVSDNALFGKAKMTGFIFDVMSKSPDLQGLSRILAGSRDPLAFLKVIT